MKKKKKKHRQAWVRCLVRDGLAVLLCDQYLYEGGTSIAFHVHNKLEFVIHILCCLVYCIIIITYCDGLDFGGFIQL